MSDLVCLEPDLLDQATEISTRYSLRLLTQAASVPKDFCLWLQQDGLSLKNSAASSAMAVRVDFQAGANAHRRLYGGGQGQSIAKAIGIARYKPSVLDATAGLGRDSFVLASLGCVVTAFERHPAVAALLEDGLWRATSDSEVGEIVRRIHLKHGSSQQLMQECLDAEQVPDVIYLDPMFDGAEKRSAQVKKEMQAFRSLIGQDSDADQLLPMALKLARCRVVVKRAKRAEPLNQQQPTYSLPGKSNRFDIYVKAKVEPLLASTISD